MKRFLAIFLCVLLSLGMLSCNKEEGTTPTTQGGSTSTTKQPSGSTEPKEIYEVTGKTYYVDLSTINVGWDEDSEPTQIKKETFIALIKNEFGSSVITFTDGNGFVLSGTNNGNHNATATDCQRADNELYAELENGVIDIMIYEDKVVVFSDLFAKGWGMYFSLDYVENKE